jgi:hypothetical protein
VVGYVLTRTLDFNQIANILYGDTVAVLQGTVNANQQYTMNNQVAITVGTTAITFAQTSGGSQLTGTAPIVITGNVISAPTAVVTTGSTSTGTQVFNGSSTAEALKLTNVAELVDIVAAAPTATQTFYVASGSVQLYTTAAANNWTINFAFSAGTSMNTAMAIGDSVTVAMLTTQGATAYYANAFQVDGVAVTPKWQGGAAPTAGNASGIDTYAFTIVKTAASVYTIMGSQTEYK